MASLELGILGPLQVRLGSDDPIALGGVRQRAVLAVLALNAGQVVSTDRLVDELWGESPPASAVHTVQVFVSRLRTQLARASDRLITRPPGYVLELGVDEIDALRCERLYDSARSALAAGDAARAAAMMGEAQRLWRGPPLADFTYEPFAQASIARLEELRLSCREELIDAQLALGRHAEVIADLEALVREQPFRERPHGQLMLALYRCGRQADALEAFQQARRSLVEELGVEPGATLRELEKLILRQDESLALPGAAAAEPNPERSVAPDSEPGGAASEPIEMAPSTSTVPQPGIIRKSATVLVVELTTSDHADPEMTRNAVAAARARTQEIVTRHGGAFVAGLGGELVWVFGVPLVNEDDALRALRASVELGAALGSTQRDEVAVRVGVASGEVVVESATDLFGEPLSRAIALAQSAEGGAILLSEATRRLVSGAARVDPTPDGESWRLDGIVEGAPDRLMAHPVVDRVDELALAGAAFRRAVRGGEAHLLTVVGEPGIGKSRLGQESASRLAGQATVLTGHCLSYGDGVAFWPLREALTQFAGGDSPEAIRSLIDDAEDADLISEVVAASLGLTDSETRREQVPWAFRRLLELLARERPLELVIEDTHWAAPELLDLIDYLVDWVKAPVLLLNTARPELLDGRPSWGGGHPRVSSVVLGPLSDDDAGSLLDHRLGDRRLSESEREVILHTAEGNPLFVEQLLAMSAENPWWDREREIPATLRSLLAARIDRLGPGERAYIERAAIIGREFWPTAVVALLPEEARPTADQHLRALVRRGFVEPGSAPLAGEEQLSFHHILIRDVAYRGTPKVLRSELHERFAEWLAPRGEAYEEFVGYHLERAFRNLTEVGQSDDDTVALAGRAAGSLSSAGRRALSRGNPNAAAQLLRRAAEMCDAAGRKRPDVLLDLGYALSESGDYTDAEEVLQAALEQARATGAEGVSARALIELSYQRSHVDASLGAAEMLAVAAQTTAVFERLGDEGGLSRAWLHIALVEWIRSDSVAMERALQQALTHAERAGERRDQSRILTDLARTTVVGPRPVRDGIRRCHELLARAEGDVAATAFTEAMLAVLEAMDGQFEGGRARWRRSKRRLAEVGLGVSVAVIQMYYGYIELLAGQPENAEPELVAACLAFDQLGTRGHLSSAAGLAARVHYASGSYEESARYCAMSEAAASDDDAVSQVLWRSTRAKLLARGGAGPSAQALADEAVRLADGTDFLMMRGDALTDRAEVLAILDRAAQAGTDLESAGALYERKGIAAAANLARRAPAATGGGA